MNLHDVELHLGTCCHHPAPVVVTLNATDEPLIELRDVSMYREDRLILDRINLTVHRGDFVAITGPNGGGKTTMLRIILGLLRPSAGEVSFVGGRPRIGYLPQKNQIDAHFPLSVRDVITSGLLGIDGLSKAESRAMVDAALAKVEMADLADRPIGRLSGGQLQRALLGRAIVANPRVLVFDEPLSYVDKHFESHIYRLIADMAPQCTTLLVSHEMSTIDAMANRHLIVDRTVTECHAARHIALSTCED